MSTNPGRIDKYELQERLGQSGMAEVWKAFDTQARHYVAIKLLQANLKTDPDFVARFQREAPVIASLHYPNIVQCYDFSITQFPETASTTAYMVMDYVEGGTLASYTRNTTRGGMLLPITNVVLLFSPIGMAVDYAHQQRIIHGNLKPANILLDKQNTSRIAIGEPMVTDFAMSKLVGVGSGSASGWWNSTPHYISPEQVMGSTANERSDIYSLGIILYELCTGTLPFLGNNASAIMMQHVNTIPASPSLINPNLPPALSEVVMRCIAKDPAARFPSASALVAALADVTSQGSFNRPALETSGQSSGSDHSTEMYMPTVISSKMSPLPAGVAPSTPVSSSNIPPGGISQPDQVGRSGGPITPMLPAYTPTYTAGNQPAGISMPPPGVSPSKNPKRRRLLIALSALLILALIGSALGAYFAFFSKGATTSTTPQIVGHAYFVSSGLLNASSSQGISNVGITDQLQINLENIPPPQSGKAYYAWLLSDTKMKLPPIYLGQLTAQNSLSFSGDTTQHADLLATYSRFLITEEDATIQPTSPSLDPNAWVYYAEFSQVPNPADPEHFSLYDHIRHLLAEDPKVNSVGKLTGGLDTWLYRNTQKILEWGGSARDLWSSQNSGLIHRQLVRILDYLDGNAYVQQDLQSHGQVVNASQVIDANFSKFSIIGLLTLYQTETPPGYLKHIGSIHLHEISMLPQSSAAQRALAIQINQALDQVNLWLQAMHDDVVKLIPMTNAQLFGNDGRSLLNEVAKFANYAFAGNVDPHDQVTDGVVQVNYNIQRLATFDIRACTTSNPCAIS